MAQLAVDGFKQIGEYVGHSSSIHEYMSRLWNWLKHLVDQAELFKLSPLKLNSINIQQMIADRKYKRSQALQAVIATPLCQHCCV